MQTRHYGHAARSARLQGPGASTLWRKRRHIQPRGQRKQLGGRTLRAQQPVRERLSKQQQQTGRRSCHLFIASTTSTAQPYVHRRQYSHGLCDPQEETASTTTTEIRENATHHCRFVTFFNPLRVLI